MGVVFLGIVSIWALIEGQVATTEDLRWLVPLPWVIAGAAGLFVIMMSRGNEPAAPAAVYEYAAQPEPVSAPDYTSDLEAKLEAETAACSGSSARGRSGNSPRGGKPEVRGRAAKRGHCAKMGACPFLHWVDSSPCQPLIIRSCSRRASLWPSRPGRTATEIAVVEIDPRARGHCGDGGGVRRAP